MGDQRPADWPRRKPSLPALFMASAQLQSPSFESLQRMYSPPATSVQSRPSFKNTKYATVKRSAANVLKGLKRPFDHSEPVPSLPESVSMFSISEPVSLPVLGEISPSAFDPFAEATNSVLFEVGREDDDVVGKLSPKIRTLRSKMSRSWSKMSWSAKGKDKMV